MEPAGSAPPMRSWCVGPAGRLFEEAVVGVAGCLEAAGGGPWVTWIADSVREWQIHRATGHFREALGGNGSLADFNLTRRGEPSSSWLNAAFVAARFVAGFVASAAERDENSFQQVRPPVEPGDLAVIGYRCQRCGSRYFSPDEVERVAAAAWASTAVPERIQAGEGNTIAATALRAVLHDGVAYLDHAAATAEASGLEVRTIGSYATWHCPNCEHREWRRTEHALY